MPSFDFNRAVTEKAEKCGFEFALSMIKLRGFGGASEYRDDNLESFTFVAGLAAVTTRMAVTIDPISHGRLGMNIVSAGRRPSTSRWAADQAGPISHAASGFGP